MEVGVRVRVKMQGAHADARRAYTGQIAVILQMHAIEAGLNSMIIVREELFVERKPLLQK